MMKPKEPIDLQQCCADGRGAALHAWKTIEKFYRGQFKIIEKKGEGPATEADLLADKTILEILQKSYSPTRFGYLTEESVSDMHRLQCDYCWIIDPIDGTRDFIEGKTDFAVQIGLAGNADSEGQVPLVGVVYLPIHQLMFTAVTGCGAFVENLATGERKKISVTSETDHERMNMVVTRSHWGHRMKSVIDHLKPAAVSQRGSLGVKVCDVALGVADAYINTARKQCKEWDTCAPHAILNEAGGILTDIEGAEVRYNKENVYIEHGLVASNADVHGSLVKELRSIKELWES